VVDLRDALRPFVDEAATAERRPVTEVAARAGEARRRRLRRRSTAAAGLAVLLAIGGFALLGSGDGSDPAQVSVVDQPSRPTRTTTAVTDPPAPTTTPSTTAATAPTTTSDQPMTTTAPAENGPDLVALTDGVTATATTTSSWDTGFCVEVRVENTTGAAVDWVVRYRPRGSIATLWNAVAVGDEEHADELTGDGFNHRLDPGARTTFGACVDR
jgi:hypothetical protein